MAQCDAWLVKRNRQCRRRARYTAKINGRITALCRQHYISEYRVPGERTVIDH